MSIAPLEIGPIESAPAIQKKPETDLGASFGKALDEAPPSTPMRRRRPKRSPQTTRASAFTKS